MFGSETERYLIADDDEAIARALEDASIPVLLLSMIHMSGDLSILDGPLRPAGSFINEIQGFMAEEDKAEVRKQALQVIKAFKANGCRLPPPPSPKTLHRMVNFMLGEQVPDNYLAMILDELKLESDDRPDSRNHGNSTAEACDHKVLIIGGGMSGILMAVRLHQAGIPFVVIEKNSTVGGTWLENQYPGVRVDVSSHLYSYSFEPAHHWTEYFSQQPELLSYFEGVVDKYNLRQHFKLNTEVTRAVYDGNSKTWRVDIIGGAGQQTLTANTVISAVGQLNRPKIPDLPGLDTFKGKYCHTAEWHGDIDITDKNVVVVGAGASAFQLVPAIAERAGRLTVFQRTAPWMFENNLYHEKVPEGLKWCLSNLPFYSNWYRFLLFWPACDGAYDSVVVDPDWPHQERSASELNDIIRGMFSEYISNQVADDKELLKKVLPDYPPMARRTLQDNGSWLSALKRENVQVEKKKVTAVTESGVIAKDGSFTPADVIIFATGFQVDKFLWPMEIQGKGGVLLSDAWADEPTAYLGITVSGFPNFYCLFGPGTNLAFGGSLIFNAECQARYILDCLRYLLNADRQSIELNPDVHEDYQRRFRDQHAKLIWELPTVHSYYRNARGKVTLLWPWKIIDMWSWTKSVNARDYTLL